MYQYGYLLTIIKTIFSILLASWHEILAHLSLCLRWYRLWWKELDATPSPLWWWLPSPLCTIFFTSPQTHHLAPHISALLGSPASLPVTGTASLWTAGAWMRGRPLPWAAAPHALSHCPALQGRGAFVL